jgi:hypothetical protein
MSRKIYSGTPGHIKNFTVTTFENIYIKDLKELLNMFSKADQYLLGGPAATSCCGYCCCRRRMSLRSGVLWTCFLLIVEALWHIT